MAKQIQIDFELFCDLLSYFHNHQEEQHDYDYDEIYEKLSDKADKIINRELFSKYKRAATPEERERYRQEYLNRREISKSFRTDKEVPKEEL